MLKALLDRINGQIARLMNAIVKLSKLLSDYNGSYEINLFNENEAQMNGTITVDWNWLDMFWNWVSLSQKIISAN